MPLDGISDVNDIENVSNGEDRSVPIANDGTYSTFETGVAIDSTGALVELDTRGKDTLDVAVSADTESSAQFGVEASPDGETWVGPTVSSDAGVTEWFDTLVNGSRFVRLTVIEPASNGTTATTYMEASALLNPQKAAG
ncbi:hypothetical protein [Haloplanus ruber]|uniref:F5/8 type C domain-containing protein n=1 Tax=Haloplanus ruber TaxID=869892 RepID=A0ABD6CWQ4_9EURY|nr:hypothetical protein [Haloplanus ruber]